MKMPFQQSQSVNKRLSRLQRLTISETRDIREKLSVIVVVIRVDLVLAVSTEVIQRLVRVTSVHVDKISIRPQLNADQHNVDTLWMIQLQQQANIIH